MVVTVVLSGVPRYITLVELATRLDHLLDSDEIGSFNARDLSHIYKKRVIALDFKTGFDAMAAQEMLNGREYEMEDGREYKLRAKICNDPDQVGTSQHAPLDYATAAQSFRNEQIRKMSSRRLEEHIELLWEEYEVADQSRNLISSKIKLCKRYLAMKCRQRKNEYGEESDSDDLDEYSQSRPKKLREIMPPSPRSRPRSRTRLDPISPQSSSSNASRRSRSKSRHSESPPPTKAIVPYSYGYHIREPPQETKSSTSRSLKRSKSRDRERSKSRDRDRSKSKDLKRFKSKDRKRSKLKGRKRSMSKDRKQSKSIDRKRSKLKDRKRSMSRDRTRSKSIDRKQSMSRDRTRSKSIDRKRSMSRDRKRSKSIDRKRSKSIDRKRSKSRDRKRSKSKHHKRSMSRDCKRSKSIDRKRSKSRDRKRSKSKDRRRLSSRRSPLRRSSSRSSSDQRRRRSISRDRSFYLSKRVPSPRDKVYPREKKRSRLSPLPLSPNQSISSTDCYRKEVVFINRSEDRWNRNLEQPSTSRNYLEQAHSPNISRRIKEEDFTYNVVEIEDDMKPLETDDDTKPVETFKDSPKSESSDEEVDENNHGPINVIISMNIVKKNNNESRENNMTTIHPDNEENIKSSLKYVVPETNTTVANIKTEKDISVSMNKQVKIEENDDNSRYLKTVKCVGRDDNSNGTNIPKRISSNPKFVIVVQRLLKHLKVHIDNIEDSIKYKLLSIAKVELRNRIKKLLENKGYTPSNTILKLYREIYSLDEDAKLVEELINNLKQGKYDGWRFSDDEDTQTDAKPPGNPNVSTTAATQSGSATANIKSARSVEIGEISEGTHITNRTVKVEVESPRGQGNKETNGKVITETNKDCAIADNIVKVETPNGREINKTEQNVGITHGNVKVELKSPDNKKINRNSYKTKDTSPKKISKEARGLAVTNKVKVERLETNIERDKDCIIILDSKEEDVVIVKKEITIIDISDSDEDSCSHLQSSNNSQPGMPAFLKTPSSTIKVEQNEDLKPSLDILKKVASSESNTAKTNKLGQQEVIPPKNVKVKTENGNINNKGGTDLTAVESIIDDLNSAKSQPNKDKSANKDMEGPSSKLSSQQHVKTEYAQPEETIESIERFVSLVTEVININ